MIKDWLAKCLPVLWYRPRFSFALLPLLPLSWLFGLLSGLRRAAFRCGLAQSHRLSVPVIIVGNLTVGGAGKTPLVIWLVEQLRAKGFRPGVISRGYGGAGSVSRVDGDSDASDVGDEPLLLARRCQVPVYVGRDRVAAAKSLLVAHPECNVIISDDGLQHYRLQRDVEIVVFDGRGAGNRRLLPAGPLREPLAQLGRAVAIVWNSAPPSLQFANVNVPQFYMRLVANSFYALEDNARRCSVHDLNGRRLHALAGIGDPSRFFRQLTSLGLTFDAHPFPDHHAYVPEDLAFASDGVLLMTEKDAVKCAAFPLRDAWVLPVEASLESTEGGISLPELLLERLNGRSSA